MEWIDEAKQRHNGQHLITSNNNEANPLPFTHGQLNGKTLLRTQSWKQVGKKNRTTRRRRSFEDGGKKIRQKNRFEILDKLSDNGVNNADNVMECLISATNTSNVNRHILKPNINQPNDIITIQPNKRRLTVASDSQGRGLSTILGLENDGQFKIYGICQPGATINTIMLSVTNSSEFRTLSKKDCVVVIGGTNDMIQQTREDKQQFLNTFSKHIQEQIKLFNHTNIILATVPYRYAYDLKENSNINELIKDTNLLMRSLTHNQPNIKILDLYLLQSRHHTKHGLHINKRGKRYICNEIIRMANSMVQNSDSATELHAKGTSPGTSESITNQVNDGDHPITNSHTDTLWKEEIEVIETDMADIIDTYKHDPEVAFAHCISRDFGDQRHMSAGVAVKFRKRFGHPKLSDCVSDYLCIQRPKNQAAVYGLVTKQKYCDKPTEQDYNKAIDHLTKDVLHRGFKKLICSPLGCIRDKIHPGLFVKNIIALQKMTGASVRIIIQDERSSRNLRNGLKHHEFVDVLQNSILSAQSLDLQLDSTDQFPSLSQSQVLSIDQNTSAKQSQPVGWLPSTDRQPPGDRPSTATSQTSSTDCPPPTNHRPSAATQVIGDTFLG